MSRLVTAAELGRLAPVRRELDAAIADVLHRIDEKLRAHQFTAGAQSVKINLPAVTGVRGVDATESRTIMYAKIVASLVDRGFKPFLVEDDAGGHVLFVNWVAHIDDNELAEMERLLAQVRRYPSAPGLPLSRDPPRPVYRSAT